MNLTKVTPKVLRTALARRSLARFTTTMMPAYELSAAHRLIIEKLEALFSGKIRKLALITPPRIGKTTISNIFGPAFVLGRNPREKIITVSYGSELSETWGRRVRNTIADPLFREIFPGCELSPDSQAAYRFETTAGGEYTATGRGGPITGKGASLLMLDDLIKDWSEANSEAICKGTIEWLQSTAFTRLSPNACVLAVGTRWSAKDPLGWVLEQPGWEILHLPAFAGANDPLGRQPGEALWPSMFPVEALEVIKRDIGARIFSCLYQGDATAATGNIFKRDWFRYYSQPPEKFDRIIQSWDCGFKTGVTNDFSVCCTIGVTKNAYYLLSLFRKKIEFPELVKQVGSLADFWKPNEILVEDRASGQSLVQELKTASSFPVIPVKADRDKQTRAEATTGFYESGKIFLPESAPWLSDVEDELCSFPSGLHDDIVDSLSQALNRLRDHGSGLEFIQVLKDLASGKRKMPDPAKIVVAPKPPVETRVESRIPVDESKPKQCPSCGLNNLWDRGPQGIHCNQCGIDFDRDGNILSPVAESEECNSSPTAVHIWQMIGAGERKCMYCAVQRWLPGQKPNVTGESRSEHERRRRTLTIEIGRFDRPTFYDFRHPRGRG